MLRLKRKTDVLLINIHTLYFYLIFKKNKMPKKQHNCVSNKFF